MATDNQVRIKGALVLQILRAKKKWSQGEVAKKVGLSQSAYSRHEAGVTSINLELMVKVCEVYGIKTTTFTRKLEELLK
jgi:transcriptional regulator with XRE-family HTH domain